MPMVKIKYRLDKRIRVVEVRTGSKVFIVDLETFCSQLGVYDFEYHVGEASINIETYSYLWKERIASAISRPRGTQETSKNS